MKELVLSPEELRRIKRFRLMMLPVRVLVGLSLLSLVAGGPQRFFSESPGQIFGGLFALQVFVERIFQAPDAGGRRRDQGSVVVTWLGVGMAYMVAMADYYWIRPYWSVTDWNYVWLLAALGLFAVGQSIRVVAIRALGRFFTVSVRLLDGQRVVQEGIYARLRHPAYSGLLLICLAYVTLFSSVFGYVAFFLFAVPGVMHRIKLEEKTLTDEFGDEYQRYCQKTERLIPFIY